MKSKPDELNTGLKPKIFNLLNEVFSTYEAIDTVVLYGSRAKGTYHAGSDIDITITGKNFKNSLVGKIEDDIDNLLLPYSFDISSWSQIDNDELRAHIERVGIIIYQGL